MATVIEALEAMEAAAQGNARLEAMSKHDSPELRKILYLTLSPFCTFGVKKLPDVKKGERGFNDNYWYPEFVALAHKLAERELTGHAAQDAIASFLSECSDTQRKWSERIIKQDLRLNVGAKDVNNTFGKNTIYLFEVPLATDYAKVKPKDLLGMWALQPKLDGGRAVAILPMNGGRVKMLSRTGKEWLNFESIRKVLQKFNNERSSRDMFTLYLDGEVVSIVNGRIDFQSIQKTMHATDLEVGKLEFVVFDSATEFEWKNTESPYRERYDDIGIHIGQLVSVLGSPIKRVKGVKLKDPTPDQLRDYCAQLVEEGYEGAMLRKLNEPVKNKRSKDLLKVKLFQDDEAEIIGQVEGTGKYVGMLGALVCKTKEGVQFELGTGFVDAQRTEYWRNSLVGRIANFKYFEKTEARVPRLPVFRSVRHPDDMGSGV